MRQHWHKLAEIHRLTNSTSFYKPGQLIALASMKTVNNHTSNCRVQIRSRLDPVGAGIVSNPLMTPFQDHLACVWAKQGRQWRAPASFTGHTVSLLSSERRRKCSWQVASNANQKHNRKRKKRKSYKEAAFRRRCLEHTMLQRKKTQRALSHGSGSRS